MSIKKAIAAGMGDQAFSKNSPFGRVNFALFFDKNAVMTRLDRRELSVLSRTGAYSRGVMRRSIKRGRSSKRFRASRYGGGSHPGEAPRYWTRGFASLKDGIFFQSDLDEGSVVIGPNLLRTRTQPADTSGGAELLEYGGAASITMYHYNQDRPGTWKRHRVRYKKRPYVEPALKPTAKKFNEFLSQYDLL